MTDETFTGAQPVSSSLGQAVYAKLRQSILSGYYRPGQRLTEIALAEEVQASRTPVVNALKALTEQGLVRYETHRGYWVREFDLGEVLQAYDIRASLEGLACRQAAEKGVARQTLEALDECIRIGRQITRGPELVPQEHAAYQQMNVRFHNAIIEACGNRLLPEFIRKSHELPLASDRVVMWKSVEIVRRSHDDHVRVLDAIRNRQGARAEMLMREHIYEAGQVIARHWPELRARAHLTDPARARIDTTHGETR
ncbi:GntR family transcriptional regulator [Diaphorobacter ruginosibacter]|uniref:GntR family transcriptional regulator n=1 Tax=Diaphorobacter ruginosibacter TaxID=1715720 RepID=UPI003342449E